MTEWAARRFWTEATAEPAAGGWTVALDGRPMRTPSRQPLTMPTEAMADAVAAEWQAQEDRIEPATMPVTRAVNSAIDKVAPQMAAVVAALAAYAETDLLCYRAAAPEALVARQAAAWDPLLEWSATALGARLHPVEGVMPQPQDAVALGRLADEVASHDSFALTGLHDLVMLSGSLVLALAVVRGRLTADAAWTLSRLDEEWQMTQWGRDGDAEHAAAIRREAFVAGARFVELSR